MDVKDNGRRPNGARGLRAIIENVMTDTMYELPSMEGVKKCIITKEAVVDGERPRLIFAQPDELPEEKALPEPKSKKVRVTPKSPA